MSKKIDLASSKHNMNTNLKIEDLLNHKFKQRFEVSKELHSKILESTTVEKETNHIYWCVAAGLAILISLNVFSIRNYNKQVKNERLKEQYSNNWNSSSIF
ncbi:MAG: hypothetical protein ACKO7P_00080 [Bacteroidota bacterium]